ncbi:unnamed protein product, partial [Ixodes persulcatus]
RTLSATRVPATFNAVRLRNISPLALFEPLSQYHTSCVRRSTSQLIDQDSLLREHQRSNQWVHPASVLECVIAKCRVVSSARNSVALARPGAEEWMQLTGDGELRRCNYYSEHEAVHRDNWESSEYSWLVCKQVRSASQTSSFRSLTA